MIVLIVPQAREWSVTGLALHDENTKWSTDHIENKIDVDSICTSEQVKNKSILV